MFVIFFLLPNPFYSAFPLLCIFPTFQLSLHAVLCKKKMLMEYMVQCLHKDDCFSCVSSALFPVCFMSAPCASCVPHVPHVRSASCALCTPSASTPPPMHLCLLSLMCLMCASCATCASFAVCASCVPLSCLLPGHDWRKWQRQGRIWPPRQA
jgi:hypothetical protein